ncbi:hypothetical protein [Siccibacter colletis]|uniref:Uncharacterized protein n=1 Tax=Siccibacter colletis TaxID=1505757 RepID=A0ABY6JCK8_9ENTR|nr:hypothetical protein [Siccibacter colletis]UYU31459.1 hypothetical protein KFZ77_16755 [Siccibacter colletis]
MLKATVLFSQVVVGIYLAGDIARQNPKFDAFLSLVEDGYHNLNNRIKEAQIQEGMGLLRKLAGVCAFIFFLLLITVPRLSSDPEWYSTVFIYCFFGAIAVWGGLSWCMQHTKTLGNAGGVICLTLVSPFALALLEKQTGIPVLAQFLGPLFYLFAKLGFPIDPLPGTWAMAFILCGFLIFALVVQYILTWAIAIPIMALSVLAVVGIIQFAKIVNVIAPKKAFSGLMIVIFILLGVVQYVWL